MKLFKPKYLFKLAWFGFGLFGLIVLAKQYFPDLWPRLQNTDLVKGIQGELISTSTKDLNIKGEIDEETGSTQLDLKQLDPQQAGQAVAKVISEKIVELVKETTVEVKHFPAKQIRKIKIGACEELLEEDICSVASELQCGL